MSQMENLAFTSTSTCLYQQNNLFTACATVRLFCFQPLLSNVGSGVTQLPRTRKRLCEIPARLTETMENNTA